MNLDDEIGAAFGEHLGIGRAPAHPECFSCYADFAAGYRAALRRHGVHRRGPGSDGTEEASLCGERWPVRATGNAESVTCPECRERQKP